MNGEKINTVSVRDLLGLMTVGDLVAHVAERRVDEIRRYQKALRRKARQVAKLRAELVGLRAFVSAYDRTTVATVADVHGALEVLVMAREALRPKLTIPAIMSHGPVNRSEAQVTHWERDPKP